MSPLFVFLCKEYSAGKIAIPSEESPAKTCSWSPLLLMKLIGISCVSSSFNYLEWTMLNAHYNTLMDQWAVNLHKCFIIQLNLSDIGISFTWVPHCLEGPNQLYDL